MYPITQAIWQGRFAAPLRLAALREAGITHILNVCEAPAVLTVADGPFVEVCSFPIEDLVPIPIDVALDALETLHRMAAHPHSRVYVHCIAGCNRSPTILWLYLVACGVGRDVAEREISRRNIDAVPVHPRLIYPQLVERAIAHMHPRLPHPRPAALEFV
ncbi:MAG: dual specificity protein phosphatase family protein [Pirellulaceae bacterium]|jgi:protein-tyrosine phosphatase|nr:dual specificity protein phosphatase family protein [Pirellulaceae bacterium]